MNNSYVEFEGFEMFLAEAGYGEIPFVDPASPSFLTGSL